MENYTFGNILVKVNKSFLLYNSYLRADIFPSFKSILIRDNGWGCKPSGKHEVTHSSRLRYLQEPILSNRANFQSYLNVSKKKYRNSIAPTLILFVRVEDKIESYIICIGLEWKHTPKFRRKTYSQKCFEKCRTKIR